MNPLTHHDILERVGPFTRRGRHVDLAASDRVQRRIAFKSIDHPETAHAPRVRETLVLEDMASGSYRLTRLLNPVTGPSASLEAVGTKPAELLAHIDAVPAARQFGAAEDVSIAFSFRLRAGPDAGDESMILTRGAAQVAGLDVTLDVSAGTRGPAAVSLRRPSGDGLRLPQDVLAVLGGQWSRLRDTGDGWAGEVRLGGREPRRTRQAIAAIEAAVPHLARTLREPPRRFHERFSVARWRVFCRRLVPLTVCIGLILCAATVPKLHLAEGSGLRMLILNSPPLLMIMFFCLREVPVVEIPPLPRRSDAASWHEGRAPSSDAATSANT